MIGKPIDEISEQDLQTLVENKVIERKTLEYKQALPRNSDKEKKEFLADVSSFANASGGDLIFGIAEDKKTGKPRSLDGLDNENIAQEILRFDNIIRTGIQPRLPSVTISPPISLKNSKVALIIRVLKSWISPHRVTFGGHDKFYSRSSNGKYHMDVVELRTAFTLSETITERIRNFRLDRISKILSDETPVPLSNNAKIVLHLVPIISFTPAQSYDLSEISANPGKMPPITGWNNSKHNFDGFLTYSNDPQGVSRSYTQLFRNGIIEAIDAYTLRLRVNRPTIPSISFEKKLIDALTSYLSILKILNVEPPAFIFLTLLSVKGFSMGIDPAKYILDDVHTIDRDILQLPEVVMENYDEKPERVLKPCFDSIWNACGFRKDFYYDDEGNWEPDR